jgi:hypothetical protein
MGIHLLRCAHGNEHTRTHDAIHDTFVAVTWDVGFHVGRKQLHALLSNMFNSFRRSVDIVLTLKMAFAPQSTLSLPTQHERIYILDLAPPKDLLLSMRFKPKNGAITIDALSINSSPYKWRYLNVYISKWMCF